MLVALDAGTTSVRALAFERDGRVLDAVQRPLSQHFPAPGLVEQDPAELLALVDVVLAELASRLDGARVDAIGITNQRETVVAIDRDDGRMLSPAIVWQDRRTADACSELVRSGAAVDVRRRTGLPCDPYFSATKLAWLLEHAPLDTARELGLCTVDTLVCWHLTGGRDGGRWVTDHSNASRTMLYELDSASWSEELCRDFGVPRDALADVVASSGVLGEVRADAPAPLRGRPIAGVLGDQQAALLGQGCLEAGNVKATFGTGAFLLLQAGPARPADLEGLVTTVAWDLGQSGPRCFALEGAAFVAGAALQWLCEGLGLFEDAAELASLAGSLEDAGGVSFVPALAGLGSPWWDASARGALVGLASGVGRAHVARAALESLAHQGRAMLEAMARSGIAPDELCVDGGAAVDDRLCQMLADGTRCRVLRPASIEATARGAAFAAGLGTGAVSLADLASSFEAAAAFEPSELDATQPGYDAWLEALRRARELGAELGVPS